MARRNQKNMWGEMNANRAKHKRMKACRREDSNGDWT